jgi:putative transposase
MPNYRRAFIPGGCWFFTVNLLDRRKTLLVDQIELLRGAVAATRRSHTFTIDAFVAVWFRVCGIGRIPLFIETFAQDYFRLIGRAMPKQSVISASENDANGGLRFANPPYKSSG